MAQYSKKYFIFSTVKIGKVSMDKASLVKNVMRGVYRVIPHILGD
jgi:ribosomal protein L1